MNLDAKSSKVNQGAQPSGIPVHGTSRGGSGPVAGTDQYLFNLHAHLCELVTDVDKRAKMLGVPKNVDAAWIEGRMVPVMRAHRKPLEAAVANAERATSK